MTIGISVLSLALLFEVYGDVPLGPFLGVLFYEFARDMEEDADRVWEVVDKRFEVELEPEIVQLEKVLFLRRYFELSNADTDYIERFAKEYGIELDELFDTAIKYCLVKEGLSRVVISKHALMRALGDAFD
jgi:RNAse (barnase) inhibitor barstar